MYQFLNFLMELPEIATNLLLEQFYHTWLGYFFIRIECFLQPAFELEQVQWFEFFGQLGYSQFIKEWSFFGWFIDGFPQHENNILGGSEILKIIQHHVVEFLIPRFQ